MFWGPSYVCILECNSQSQICQHCGSSYEPRILHQAVFSAFKTVWQSLVGVGAWGLIWAVACCCGLWIYVQQHGLICIEKFLPLPRFSPSPSMWYSQCCQFVVQRLCVGLPLVCETCMFLCVCLFMSGSDRKNLCEGLFTLPLGWRRALLFLYATKVTLAWCRC